MKSVEVCFFIETIFLLRQFKLVSRFVQIPSWDGAAAAHETLALYDNMSNISSQKGAFRSSFFLKKIKY